MAALAVFVVSNIQLPDLALSFYRIVTLGALLNRLSFFPDVLSVFIVVVTRITGIDIALGMFGMGKIHGSLTIGLVNLVIDGNLLGNFLHFGGICSAGCHKQETKWDPQNEGQNSGKNKIAPLPAFKLQIHRVLLKLAKL
jgi:hypothetical protein